MQCHWTIDSVGRCLGRYYPLIRHWSEKEEGNSFVNIKHSEDGLAEDCYLATISSMSTVFSPWVPSSLLTDVATICFLLRWNMFAPLEWMAADAGGPTLRSWPIVSLPNSFNIFERNVYATRWCFSKDLCTNKISVTDVKFDFFLFW